jgi:BTB/POZ domain
MEFNPILNIDVGGQKFRVLRETVMRYSSSLLAQVVSGKDIHHMVILDGCYFFDRNPQYFSVILDYMRIGKIFLPPSLLEDQLKEELAFWKIDQQLKTTNSSENLIEPTLIIPEAFIEPTLIIPDTVEPTLLASQLIGSNSPIIEPTLIIQDAADLNLPEQPLRNSIKEFRIAKNSQIETKKEIKKLDQDSDDLLSSLIPEDKPAPARTLPWGSKDTKKLLEPKKNLETDKISQKKLEKPDTKPKQKKNLEESEEDLKYESSFIDDDDDDFSISSNDFKLNKRKKTAKPPPNKKLKPSNGNKSKKGTIPNLEELSNALKNMR